MKPIQFIDLQAQKDLIRPNIDNAIQRVLEHGEYIMGPEVLELEQQLADFCNVKHVITCSNGTDALSLGLIAKNVEVGDAVFVPSFTFAATAEVVALLGATPVFIDSLPDTYNIDPESLLIGIQTAKKAGLKPVGIITVDLFGQPVDYDAIKDIAEQNSIWIIADAAQSFGADYKGIKVGNFGDITTTSFFPAKPLGCYGDGGAVFTNDDELAKVIKSLRVHGQGSDKYDNIRVGINGRLDTIQAAILLEKLKIFPEEIIARQQAADTYNKALETVVQIPYVPKDMASVWAQYTIQLPERVVREKIISDLKSVGIPSVIYYVKPLHQQTAYNKYLIVGNALPVCEKLSKQVLSLPMSGYITTEQVQYITKHLVSILK